MTPRTLGALGLALFLMPALAAAQAPQIPQPVHSVHLVQALSLQQVIQWDPGHLINGNIQMIIL